MAKEFVTYTDVYAPEHIKAIKFEGYHPSRVLFMINSMFKDVFRITAPAMYQDNFRWDVSGDPIEFYSANRAIEGKDIRTNAVAQIFIHGFMNSKDKMGHVTIYLLGWLITKTPCRNELERGLIILSDWLYYNKIRRRYLKVFRDRMMEIENIIKTEFELMKATGSEVREKQ